MTASVYQNYRGIIAAFQPNGQPRQRETAPGVLADLTTEPDGDAQFGVMRIAEDSAPWFQMHLQRGMGNGFLEIAASSYDYDYGTSPLQKGDWVRFCPESGIEWARLRVQRIGRKLHSWVYDLVGESSAFFGRPVTSDAYNSYLLSDFFRLSAESSPYAININIANSASNKTPGQVVSWIINNSLSDYSGSPFSAAWFNSRRINENNPFVSPASINNFLFRLDENQTCADAIQDLATLAQNYSDTPWAWGVSNGFFGGLSAGSGGTGRAFFFAPRPATTMMTFLRVPGQPIAATLRNEATGSHTDAHCLNWPERQTADFFNAVEVTYGTGRRVVERNNTAIANEGGFIRLARESIPTIRTEGVARIYGQAFLRRFAAAPPVYDPIVLIPPGPYHLPVPWGGRAAVVDGADTHLMTIRDVKVVFAEQPRCEISVGDVE